MMLLGNNGIIRYKWNWSHTKHVSGTDYAGFRNRTAVIAAVIRMRRPIAPSKRERSPIGDAGFFGLASSGTIPAEFPRKHVCVSLRAI